MKTGDRSAARRLALRRLLRDGACPSQSEIRRRLREEGFEATQATISRDLTAIGARKAATGDGPAHYILFEGAPDGGAGQRELRDRLAAFVTQMQAAENLLVIKTLPGAAPAVASALDGAGDDWKLVGTLAGDDTVLAVLPRAAAARQTRRRLQRLLEGRA